MAADCTSSRGHMMPYSSQPWAWTMGSIRWGSNMMLLGVTSNTPLTAPWKNTAPDHELHMRCVISCRFNPFQSANFLNQVHNLLTASADHFSPFICFLRVTQQQFDTTDQCESECVHLHAEHRDRCPCVLVCSNSGSDIILPCHQWCICSLSWGTSLWAPPPPQRWTTPLWTGAGLGTREAGRCLVWTGHRSPGGGTRRVANG